MNLETLQNPRPVEGIFDLNLTLNFGKQWPEMKDFAYETRQMFFDTLYNWEHVGAIGLGFVLGVLMTTAVVLITRRRPPGTSASLAALLLATLMTTPLAAQDIREPQVDLVTISYVDKNFGSRIDGAGMCVFNSFRGSLVSQYREDFDDYARWLAANFQGGGYPSRVTEYTRAYCRAKGIDGFDEQYVQIVGEDTITAMEQALADGRSPALTYSGDPSFYGGPVPHMVNLVYADASWWGIVDNNRPDRIEWVQRETGIKRHRHYDAGWAIIYLGKPQLSRPTNKPPDPPRDRASLQYRGLGLPLLFARSPDTGHTWHDQGDGVWYLQRGNVRVGEYHERDGRYYTYRLGGGLVDTELPFKAPTSKVSLPTGVYYGGFPELRRGQTLYGYGSTPVADPSNRRLYEDRIKSDKHRARVVVNGSADLEARVRSLVKQLKSNAWVYGREALDVIQAMGYGKGVTVTAGTKNGVAWEVNFFQQEPSDVQLRDALIRADPSYRPGNGLTEAVDSLLIVLALVLAGLVAVYLFINRKGSQ